MKTNTKTYLLENGIKPSLQRIALMDYLLSHRTHPSVDEIYNDLYQSIPTLSKTTVYNTMKLFVAKGVALMIEIDKKTARFDGYVHQHAHFICQECGTIFDLDVQESAVLNLPSGFSKNEVQIYVKGVCQKCNNKKN